MTAATTAPHAPPQTRQNADLHTGHGILALILTASPGQTRDRYQWNLFHRAFAPAARALARSDALHAALQPGTHVTGRELQQLTDGRAAICSELYEFLYRDLWHCPRTLAALAAGSHRPLDPAERDCLLRQTSRCLRLHGCDPGELAIRRLTDQALTTLADALTGLEL